MAAGIQKHESGSNSQKKDKENNKQKRGTTSGLKNGANKDGVKLSEKKKQPSKRKMTSGHPNTEEVSQRKVGRPRAQSTASDIGKGKNRNLSVSGMKKSINSDHQHHGERNAHEELIEKFKGN